MLMVINFQKTHFYYSYQSEVILKYKEKNMQGKGNFLKQKKPDKDGTEILRVNIGDMLSSGQ